MKKKLLLSFPPPAGSMDRYADLFDITAPSDHDLHYEEVYDAIGDYDVFYTCHVLIDEALMKKGLEGKTRIIGNFGVGYDHMDAEAATRLGMPLVYSPSTVTDATGEHAVCLVTDVMRGISRFDRQMRNGIWGSVQFSDQNTAICGSTLGVIGLGRIGRVVAERCYGLGMKVVYYDKFRAPEEYEKKYNLTYMSFEDVLKTADCVSINTFYSPENHHMINAETLRLMKPTAYLVNISRGPLVDEAALVDALKNGVIKGAGLDVFENEPYPLPELLTLENVTLTPHCASNPLSTRLNMLHETMEGIIAVLNGEIPYNIINPEVMK